MKFEYKEMANGFLVELSYMEQKITSKVTEKVTENQDKIIQLITKRTTITSVELSKIIGISERKIKENIKKLKEKGIIKGIGPDKGGYWKVIGKIK